MLEGDWKSEELIRKTALEFVDLFNGLAVFGMVLFLSAKIWCFVANEYFSSAAAWLMGLKIY